MKEKRKLLFTNRKEWIIITGIIFIGLCLEVFLFNYKYFESYLWSGEPLHFQEMYFSDALEPLGDGTYKVLDTEEEESAFIEVRNINQEVHNLHISVEVLEPVNEANRAVNIQIKAMDAANENYMRLPERDILKNIPESEYIRLQLSGSSENLHVILNVEPDSVIQLHDLSGNVKVPMKISIVRLGLVIGVILLIYILRRKSKLHQYLYVERTWKGQVLIYTILFLHMVGIGIVSYKNTGAIEYANHLWSSQYSLMAESLADGKTYIDIEPSDTLLKMENPYDHRARLIAFYDNEDTYLWDFAYFEGKYYVYFGVLPVILFFLPWYLITGEALSLVPVEVLLLCLMAAGLFAFIGYIIKRYFPKTPLTLYLMCSVLAVNGCGIWSYARNVNIYSIAILSGVVLGIWGLYFWMSSVKEDESVDKFRVMLGSFLLAAIAGCRPQLLLLLFMSIPIFWKSFWQKKILHTKSLGTTLAFGLPIFIVAIAVMYYNQIRFGSIFDFGANYNLTSNDMTERGFKLGRTGLGIFTQLFQLPVMTAQFPYFEFTVIKSLFQGTTIAEVGYGGLFATNLVLLPVFVAIRKKELFKDRVLYLFSLLSVLFAFIIVIVDTQMAGIVPRYQFGYSWMLYLVVILFFFVLYERYRAQSAWKYIYKIFIFLGIQSIFFNILTIFTDVYASIETNMPEWFYQACYLVEFWR